MGFSCSFLVSAEYYRNKYDHDHHCSAPLPDKRYTKYIISRYRDKIIRYATIVEAHKAIIVHFHYLMGERESRVALASHSYKHIV